MGSSPQIVGNIVLFWRLLWKHPRRSFTWLENMSTHTKVLAIYCAQRESVCVRTRTFARVYAHSHMLPSAQRLSTSPRWLPEGSCLLHTDLLQTSCPCWGLRHSNALQKGDGIVNRQWWSISPLSTTVFLVHSQMQSYFKSPPAAEEVSEGLLFPLSFKKTAGGVCGAVLSPGLFLFGRPKDWLNSCLEAGSKIRWPRALPSVWTVVESPPFHESLNTMDPNVSTDFLNSYINMTGISWILSVW